MKTKKTILALLCTVLFLSCGKSKCDQYLEKLELLTSEYVELTHKLKDNPTDLNLIGQYKKIALDIATLKEIPLECKDDRNFEAEAFRITLEAEKKAISSEELDRLTKEKNNANATSTAKRLGDSLAKVIESSLKK